MWYLAYHGCNAGSPGPEAAMNRTSTLRIAQIVEWNRGGQSCIALLRGDEVIERFRDYDAARAAYAAEAHAQQVAA